MSDEMNESSSPKYWILNQLNPLFYNIPKKRKALIRDPICMTKEDFILGDLGWAPRRNSFLKYINRITSYI